MKTSKSLIFFYLYIILQPYYLWSSGIPQVSDFMLVLCIFLYLPIQMIKGNMQLVFVSPKLIKIMILLVLYIFSVNTIWSIVESDIEPFIFNLFYIFNLLAVVLLSVSVAAEGKKHIKNIVLSLNASMFFLIVVSPLFFDPSVPRQVLTFNNPNQLGIYALCCPSIALVLFGKFGSSVVKKRYVHSIMAFSFVLVMLSMSGAAIIGYFILFFLYVLLVYGKTRLIIITIASSLFIAFMGAALISSFQDSYIYDATETRINRKLNDSQSGVSTWEERGYDRIYHHPQYLAFGAGEGLYDRFDSYISGLELHSLYGTALFSYGIIGVIILLVLCKEVMYRNQIFYLLFPVAFYALTHQNLRTTMIWLILLLLTMKVDTKGDYNE